MKHKKILEQQLEEISSIISEKYSNEKNIGVVAGSSGCALFQFYYAKYLDSDYYSDLGIEIISHCIAKINDGYSFPSYCDGIAGFGWAIQHLSNEGFISVDCDDLLSPFDEFLFSQMELELSNDNLDFLHGAIGYGFYFLKRYQLTTNRELKNSYNHYLLVLLKGLDRLAIQQGNQLKWESIFDLEKGDKVANLSLSHGMSSIVNFLSRLLDLNTFQEPSRKLLKRSITYILSFQSTNKTSLSLFPSIIDNHKKLKYNSRIAWCYGDLGVGVSLLKSSKTLNDSTLEQKAIIILKHSAKRKKNEKTMVMDAGICHGSYGNAQIFGKIYNVHPEEEFKDVSNFWIEDGIKRSVFDNGYAGYKQWNGQQKEWQSSLTLLEGIAGIGLSIIDYLSDEPNNWDECLLIS